MPISFLDEPGAPRIEGYNDDTAIKENKTVTLTCISRLGNPLAQLIWFKNDAPVDSSYDTFGKESRNDFTFVATRSMDRSRLRCEAANMILKTPKIAEVVISVYCKLHLQYIYAMEKKGKLYYEFCFTDPPNEVKMTGPNEAKINDTITLTCKSSNSNPAVDIAIFKGGVALQGLHSSTTASTDGGWITFSNVSVKIDKNDRRATFTCQAVNRGYGDTKSIPHVVNVIRKFS